MELEKEIQNLKKELNIEKELRWIERSNAELSITFWMVFSFILTMLIIYVLNCPVNPLTNKFECNKE
jgi:cell division protein FtsX